MSAPRPRPRAPTFETLLRALIREELAAATSASTSTHLWNYVPASAIFPTARQPSRALARLAAREFWTLTRIAGELYARRVDIDALAARNAIAPTLTVADDDAIEREVGADLLAAFGEDVAERRSSLTPAARAATGTRGIRRAAR